MLQRSLFLLVPLLAACGREETAVLAASGTAPRAAPPPVAGVVLEPGGEEGLVHYAWKGSGSIPWLRPAGDRTISFRERGRDARTGFYLTFNGELEPELAQQAPGWTASATELGSAPGRYAGGGELNARTRLRVALPADLDPPVWSIEFWMRPAQLGNYELLELPGVLHAYVNEQGRIYTEVPGASDEPDPAGGYKTILVGNAARLAAGQWSHVGIVLDLGELRAVRLVVDGEVQGRRFELAKVTARPSEFLLGDLRSNGNGPPCTIDELRIQNRNVSTAEFLEHWQARPRPREELELAYADGTVEARSYWSTPLTAPRLERGPEHADEWARGELEHAFASPAGLAWTSEHWERAHTVEQPLPRTTHPTVALGGGRVFVFGGETRDTHFGRAVNTSDTWIFDATREEWSRVVSDREPSPRCHMPAAYSPDHDLVLLVGGWWNEANPGRLLKDTWVFRVTEQRWERRRPTPYGEASDHGLVYLPAQRAFLLLRGKEAWLYDPDTDRWQQRQTSAVDARGEPEDFGVAATPTCGFDPRTGKVVVFGSEFRERPEPFSDTTALFDPQSSTYTVLDAPVRPEGRVRPAFAYDPARERFVFFGGVRTQSSNRYDDLWIFDSRSETWREVPRGPVRPMARGGYYGMAYDEVGDRFVIPQGRHSEHRWFAETWFLQLDERRKGRARYLFDRAAFPERSWFADVECPGSSAVHFRFRAGEDAMTFGAWSEAAPATGRFLEVEAELLPDGDGRGPLVRAMGFRGDALVRPSTVEAAAGTAARRPGD